MTTLIIGGGLSGLALAEQLESLGHDYLLLEARDRFGGRILTERHGGASFDMGPAWFWPGQPRIAALIDRLGLRRFDQFSDGDLTFEDEKGRIQRGQGFCSMEGSWRVQGGFGALAQRLAARLPSHRKRLNAKVVTLEKTANAVRATLSNGDRIRADRAVLALPPRLAAQIGFAPALPARSLGDMQTIPTWMAGQAKAVAVYETAFWRNAGLSGDAMSRKGPMVEIHDASPAEGGPYALFGFIGIAPRLRKDQAGLRQKILAQLARLFGPEAHTPSQFYLTDWAAEPDTATLADQTPLLGHPTFGLPPSLSGLWQDRLLMSGTEVAPQFGGYLEGALEAAENTLEMLEHNEVAREDAD